MCVRACVPTVVHVRVCASREPCTRPHACVHLRVCLRVCARVRLCVCLRMCARVCARVCLRVCLRVCVRARACVCAHACACVCGRAHAHLVALVWRSGTSRSMRPTCGGAWTRAHRATPRRSPAFPRTAARSSAARRARAGPMGSPRLHRRPLPSPAFLGAPSLPVRARRPAAMLPRRLPVGRSSARCRPAPLLRIIRRGRCWGGTLSWSPLRLALAAAPAQRTPSR
jgi:hypothetical protein